MLGMCERLVGDGDRLQHIDPKFLWLFCWAVQPGSWGPKPSVWSWFSLCGQLRLQLKLQLTQTVCGTWLYNCLPTTCFLWALYQHRIQPVHRSRWYSDIFDQMHLFLDWRLGRSSICYTTTWFWFDHMIYMS